MEFFLQKFSFANEKIKNKTLQKNESKRKLNSSLSMNIDMITSLLNQGFKLEQIIFINQNFQIDSVSSAVLLMTKDSLYGNYSHKFHPNSEGKCQICLDSDSSLHEKSFNESEDDIYDYKKINELRLNEECNNKIDNKLEVSSFTKSEDEKQIQQQKILNNYINNTNISTNQINLITSDDKELCRICWSKNYKNNELPLECNHEICSECIKDYLKHKIEIGDVIEIRCLFNTCNYIFSEKNIKSRLSSTLYNKYKLFKTNKLKLSDKSSKYIFCPYVDCGKMVNLNSFLNQNEVNCEKNHVFCGKCQRQCHYGSECNDLNIELLKEIRNDLVEMKKFNYNLCPNCHVIIEKNDGCNHMQCIYCYYEFCWICLEQYEKGHYSIFSLNACAGLEFGR